MFDGTRLTRPIKDVNFMVVEHSELRTAKALKAFHRFSARRIILFSFACKSFKNEVRVRRNRRLHFNFCTQNQSDCGVFTTKKN